ncbi:MAG: hypothetical protein HYV14_12615 [Elusimicrobia bacterium]|nr:hypothetical protein [Elusimicrobiota bacterium]
MLAIALVLSSVSAAAVVRLPAAPTSLAPAAPVAAPSSLSAGLSPAFVPAPVAAASLSVLPAASAPAAPGLAAPAAAAPAAAAPGDAFLGGWRETPVASAADGTPLHFETRGPVQAAAPALFVGGLTMADSLRPLADARPRRAQAYLRLRGHPPSGWVRGADVLDADARDLARAVIETAARFRSKGVTLVLHSYAGLAFQRMVQLEADPEVDRALALLSRGRVDLVTTTSRRAGDPGSWGPDYQAAAQALSAATGWLDSVDAQTRAFQDAARWNPLLAPVSTIGGAAWEETRARAFAAAVQPFLDTARPHLEHGWSSSRPGTRETLQARAREDARHPDWNEAILRRSLAVGRLDFTPADAQRLRARGVRLLVVVADQDQLLTWPVRRLLLEALGIPSPAAEPPAGAELSDPSGLFVARIVSGDHYLPVKDPGGLAAALSL